ncbi:Hypothetical protein D9617_4g004210 [Elsinoe fawcettii]|nr:Hypothetical protein D9617_4g004210 [Elsinoe fawcettii]
MSQSLSCGNVCIDFLRTLNDESHLNQNVWDYTGDITGNNVRHVCTISDPRPCCTCNGAGVDATYMKRITRWALVCNTWVSSSHAEGAAMGCWASRFKRDCVDFQNIMERGTCAIERGESILTKSAEGAPDAQAQSYPTTPGGHNGLGSIATPLRPLQTTSSPSDGGNDRNEALSSTTRSAPAGMSTSGASPGRNPLVELIPPLLFWESVLSFLIAETWITQVII